MDINAALDQSMRTLCVKFKYEVVVRPGYFAFYAITFFGSALTSISSFLMVETLVGSMPGLSLALALKTAFSAAASPLLASLLERLELKSGLLLSQVVGLALVAPLYIGAQYHLPVLFVAAITISGASTVILNIAGTVHLKLASEAANEIFRINQGRLQLVTGLTFTTCALLCPVLLGVLSYRGVLLLDVLTYAFGATYVLFSDRVFEYGGAFDQLSLANQSTKLSPPVRWNRGVVTFTLVAISAYALKGLPPLLSGHERLTSTLRLDALTRQSLWGFEALAGIVGGYIYKRLHARFNETPLFTAGLLSSAFLLPLALLASFSVLASVVFASSLAMLLTFSKFRDDFLEQHGTKQDLIWANGYVNLVSNCVLTVSPLLIAFAVTHLSVAFAVGLALAAQIVIYVYVKCGERRTS